MSTKILILIVTSLFTMQLAAQAQVSLNTIDDGTVRLADLEASYVVTKLQAHLAGCTLDTSGSRSGWPSNRFRYLEIMLAGDDAYRIYTNANSVVTNDYRIYTRRDGRIFSYSNCDRANILPILAIMQDHALQNPDSRGDAIRQDIIAVNEYLTSHRTNRMMWRTDENDRGNDYLDFDISLKHPVLRRALDPVFDDFGLSNRNRYAQLYLAFSGRFSQYTGSRPSSPVVARRFNPELFLRFWGDNKGYWDIGYGHESNGQRITSSAAFHQEELNYLADNESPRFARDSLSRGWDYMTLNWKQDWRAAGEGNLITQFNLRYYNRDGLFQGEPEEYNTWEDGGRQARPRRNYDGIRFSAEYFLRDSCSTICVQKLELTQSTGSGRVFTNNSTTLELTTDFYGLPLHFWGRTGYNSDLIDYYDYTNSWGIGLEFISR